MRICLLTLLACILLFHAPESTSQSNNLEAQRLAVAKVRVRRHTASGVQTGAAIHVGNDQENSYFITAFHTIDPDRGGAIASVELQFSNSPQFFQAEIVDKFDETVDLGIIRIGIRRVPSQIKQLFAKEPTPASPIRIIGHPSGGDWSVWSGRIENENAPEGNSRHFIYNRDVSLIPGYSGGGIFDTEGNFLGMHLETTAMYGKGLKSREILNLLTAFRVPTNNFSQSSSLKTEERPNTRRVENKKIGAFSVATAIDRDFDGNFDTFLGDRYFRLHIRKSSNHPVLPGEYRSALLFDLRVLPKNLSIRSATLAVSPSEINGEENINVEIYGFVDYTIDLKGEAFIGGVRVAGPIKFLGARAFVAKMQSVDVSTFIKQALADGHRMIGFSIRQNDPFTKGTALGSGFTIESGESPESRNSTDGRPHLTVEYQETVDRVDYELDSLECSTTNSRTTSGTLGAAQPDYTVDDKQHLLLSSDGKPISQPDGTNLTELVSKRLLVIHSTSQILRLTRSRFAHVLIMRDGTVRQLVPFNYSVEHVINDDWSGLRPVKNHTIAIELENVGGLRYKDNAWYDWLEQIIADGEVVRLSGDIQWRGWHRFTNKQIHALFKIICALRTAYPTITDMVGHSEIDRVGDPGLVFPMEELRTKLFPRVDLREHNN